MKAVIYDTETTGKCNFKAPMDCSSHPRMVQLGALLVDIDLDTCEAEEIASVSTLIYPDGFEIPKEAENVHGISTEKALQYGVTLEGAMNLFEDLLNQADVRMAYNIAYDDRVIAGELKRLGRDAYAFLNRDNQCIMQPMTNICKLPSPWGRGYKWPKLEEAYKHCFGKVFEDAHDAMVDVRASIEVYLWYLKEFNDGRARTAT